jgi:flagellar protein FlbD
MRTQDDMLNLHRNYRLCLFIQYFPPGRKITVIFLTRTNGTTFYINPELIQTVEETPDTIITLVSNKKIIVKDTAQEVAERFIEYRRKTLAPFTSKSKKLVE